MARRTPHKELFTAAEVARFCQVDLKTIHNWSERGEIPHFRTPGRHLRFRRADVVDFLRKYGYPLPEPLRHGRPSVVVSDEDPVALETLKRVLSAHFDVAVFSDPLDAMIAVASEPPDALVLDPGCKRVEGSYCIERLRVHERTRHVRVIACSSRADLRQRVMEAGAAAFVPKGEPERVLEALRGLVQE
jgi:excisionase family DNA binding protein